MIRALLLMLALTLASACSDDRTCAVDAECFAGESCQGGVCARTTENAAQNNTVGANNTAAQNSTTGPNNTGSNNTTGANNTHGAARFVDLAAGEASTCVLDNRAQIWCWGRNTDGQLSVVLQNDVVDRPQLVVGVDAVQAIAAARHHRCALRTDGSVWCWGRDFGITGASSSNIVDAPTVMPISDIVQLEMGGNSACALESDRLSLSCWGSSDAGTTPTFVEQIADFAVGDDHNCAVLDSGAVRCWGSDYYDAVGLGDPLQGISGATAIAAGERHTCAIADGDVYCWGWNDEGQCGHPPTEFQEKFDMPQLVEGVSDAIAIYAGSTYSCALHDGDRLTCWGGLLGYDATVYTENLTVGPTQLFGLGRGVTLATAGFIHGCAAKGDDLYCWGDNGDRQLGEGGEKFRYEQPVRVDFGD